MPKLQIVPYKVSGKLSELIGADIHSRIKVKQFLYIIEHCSKFPIIRCADGLLVECLLVFCKSIFAECHLPKKIRSDSKPIYVR